jgi:hypothetical protein
MICHVTDLDSMIWYHKVENSELPNPTTLMVLM